MLVKTDIVNGFLFIITNVIELAASVIYTNKSTNSSTWFWVTMVGVCRLGLLMASSTVLAIALGSLGLKVRLGVTTSYTNGRSEATIFMPQSAASMSGSPKLSIIDGNMR